MGTPNHGQSGGGDGGGVSRGGSGGCGLFHEDKYIVNHKCSFIMLLIRLHLRYTVNYKMTKL